MYGAFPTDPYSHTPAGKGAQQPGMTGQVKEDILSRFGELGVRVSDGALGFDPTILHAEEFLTEPKQFNYINVANQKASFDLPKDSLAFTYCQVPIIYKKSTEPAIEVVLHSGESKMFSGQYLDKETSQQIFQRTNTVSKIIISTLKA